MQHSILETPGKTAAVVHASTIKQNVKDVIQKHLSVSKSVDIKSQC